MDSYTVLNRLGKGAQGVAYLVENADDGQKYVLKKVECQDESEANKAYKEALILHQMQHPYISNYKECFVHWDHEDSAMYLCVVMEYFSNGGLDKILKIKRTDRDNIEEPIIKKWIGQILDALIVIHKNNIIHRDLKPSNIFIQDELNVSMGDFGVETVMADIRTKTRSKVGSMNWMAPEVLDQPYDERSDVWSLGCIALEMSTCASYDLAQMSGRLFEIKHNVQALEDALSEVSKNYSSNLVEVIRAMLTRNYSQRPSTKELRQMPYIQECLKLSSDALNERRRKQQTDAASKPLPRGKGINAVVDYLLENINNESCIKTSLEYLADLTKVEGVKVEDSVKHLASQVMRENISLVEAQIAGCHILNNLLVNANPDDVLYTKDIISVVPLAMKSHKGSSQLQLAASALLISISANELASEIVSQVEGIQNVVNAMKKFPDNTELITTCCNAIWSLCVNDGNAKQVSENNGLQVACEALNRHGDCPELVESACAAILSLCMEDENVKVMCEQDCVGLIISAIETHIKNAKVVKNACLALAGVVEPDEENAFKVLTNERLNGDSVQGMAILQKAYYMHKDNAEVVEAICTLFMEMTEYDDISLDFESTRVPNILSEILQKYAKNEDIIQPCETALSRLGRK